MSTQSEAEKIDLLQGTLDMLILRTLVFGPVHGHAIAHAIERGSEDVLQVEHGSLYPALHRLVKQGLIAAKAGVSENNRQAKFYSLTAKGRKQLAAENSKWDRLTEAIALFLFTLPAGHLADNYDRKRIIKISALIFAAGSVGLALISWLQAPVVWYYGCLFVGATAITFLRPASIAFLTGLVSRPMLSHAVAWNSGTFQLACVLGPATSGWLIAITHHATTVFIVNAVAGLIWFTRPAASSGASPTSRPIREPWNSL